MTKRKRLSIEEREIVVSKYLKTLYDNFMKNRTTSDKFDYIKYAKDNKVPHHINAVLSKHNIAAFKMGKPGGYDWVFPGEPNLPLAKRVIKLITEYNRSTNNIYKKILDSNQTDDSNLKTVVEKNTLNATEFGIKMFLTYLKEKIHDISLSHSSLNIDNALRKYKLNNLHLECILANNILISVVNESNEREYIWDDSNLKISDSLCTKIYLQVETFKTMYSNLYKSDESPVEVTELQVIKKLKTSGQTFEHISNIIEKPVENIKDVLYKEILKS